LPSPSRELLIAKRILVADDNSLIRQTLSKLFESEGGYEICGEAKNGQEAIDLAMQRRPDLIILDWAMPILNGLDAAPELKRLLPDVPIILFTHHANALLRVELVVDRVVAKSDASTLMAHVKALAPSETV
jgi:CheY-like chemotaxis protein